MLSREMALNDPRGKQFIQGKISKNVGMKPPGACGKVVTSCMIGIRPFSKNASRAAMSPSVRQMRPKLC